MHMFAAFLQITSDFVSAATKGAMTVVDGNVMAINPGEDEKYVCLNYQNVDYQQLEELPFPLVLDAITTVLSFFLGKGCFCGIIYFLASHLTVESITMIQEVRKSFGYT